MSQEDYGIKTDKLLVRTSGTTPSLQELMGEFTDYARSGGPGFGPSPEEDGGDGEETGGG